MKNSSEKQPLYLVPGVASAAMIAAGEMQLATCLENPSEEMQRVWQAMCAAWENESRTMDIEGLQNESFTH